MNDEYGVYEDDYSIPWVRIIGGNEGLLKKIKEILNSNLTGEEYIQFNNFMDKLNNELKENEEEQEIFNDTKSSGLWVIDPHVSSYGYDIKEPTDLWKDWAKGGWHEKKIFNDRVTIQDEEYNSTDKWVRIKDMTYEIAKERVRTYLIDKHKANNDNPLYNIGSSLNLFRDYWGTYKAFSGQLKPIDIASYMTRLCTMIGNFLRNTDAVGRGNTLRNNWKYETPKWLLEDDCWAIDQFISDWNKDEDNSTKLPTKPEEVKNEEV